MKKILIIEDDKVLSEMYAIKLRKSWFEVVEAYDWLEWLTKISDFNPDVILLDLMMPVMNWFDTLKSIKHQTSSHCKILVFTNVVDRDKLDEAMQNWADDYVIKSNTNPSDMVERIKDIIKSPTVINEPIYIKPGLNIFKMKNPLWEDAQDIEISINISI